MPEPRPLGAATIVVLAKEPVPGRVKTRLMPTYTAIQAAALALAALQDTLSAATAVPGAAVVLALDGTPGEWLPAGLSVVPQRGGGLDERIAAALEDAWTPGRPILLVGMDTPQVTPALLGECLETLATTDAVLGHADDGGWWALGLHRPDPDLLLGVPMSTGQTGARQEQRIRASGRRLTLLPRLSDFDVPADVARLVTLAPQSRFAAAHARLGHARLATAPTAPTVPPAPTERPRTAGATR